MFATVCVLIVSIIEYLRGCIMRCIEPRYYLGNCAIQEIFVIIIPGERQTDTRQRQTDGDRISCYLHG